MDIKRELEKYNIAPDPLKDQFFLIDAEVIKKMIASADLKKSDVVLEIGAGTGALTQELVKKVRRVIAFEVDERFKPFLSKLPKNVEVRYENAWNYVQLKGKYLKKKEYNKVVSNLPYSFAEQFLHNLTFLKYDRVILLVPAKFVGKIETNGIFKSFFKAGVLFEVPKTSFYPTPGTTSLVINLIKQKDPLEEKNLGRFLRQYLYQHESQLIKNSLREGLIRYQSLTNTKNLTKNEARKIINKKKIPQTLLDQPPLKSEIYDLVEQAFKEK